MKSKIVPACVLSIAAVSAGAAPALYLTLDHSAEQLMNKASADKLWLEGLPAARLARLYPPGRWGFVSQVEGGFTDARVCVVTARAMLVPRKGKTLVFAPAQTATAFATLPGATQQQCRDIARIKLKEAIAAIVAPLLREK
ncbi:MAG: hypothetical protein ABIO45_14765 [Burkholderiaceae bacterium]